MDTKTQHPSMLGSAWNGLPGVATLIDASRDGALQSANGWGGLPVDGRVQSTRATKASRPILEIFMATIVVAAPLAA
jgi:hypothetical protein